ncbi:MAG: hypothetical protein COB51_01805 [Moraxellaceae bacterium]|nr:MAG: hypothetical protein COB51_01805 [Moraxellaceae bacterium]
MKDVTPYCLAAGILFLAATPVQASCGSSNCFLVTGSQHGLAAPGQVVLDLSYRYLPQNQKQAGSSSSSEVLTPKISFEENQIEADHHREISTLNSLAQFDLTFGITPRLTLGIELPFYNDRRHEHDDLVESDEHHEDEEEHVEEHEAEANESGDEEHQESEFAFSNSDGTSGLGDLSITTRYAFLSTTRHLLAGGLGVKLPTGEYELRDSQGHINEPSLMPGTGSYDYLLSGFYSYQWQPHKFDSYAAIAYRLTTENDLDYEFGNALTLSVGSNYRVIDNFIVSTQLNARQAKRDQFNGENVPSTGNTMVYLTPGLRLISSKSTEFYFHLQLPVYEKVNEVNLVPEYGVQFGVSHSI